MREERERGVSFRERFLEFAGGVLEKVHGFPSGSWESVLLGEPDHDESGISVDEGVGAEGSHVSVSGWGDDATATVVTFPLGGRLAGAHPVDRRFGQVTFSIEGTVVDEHLVEASEVFCSGEETADGHGVSGRFVFEWVGEDRDGCGDEALPGVVGFVGGGETFLLFERGVGGGVDHSEGIEDSGLDELVVGLAADEFDDASEDGVATVGVRGAGAGFEAERWNRMGACAHIERPRIPAREVEGGFGSESGHVAEEVVDADGGFDGFKNGLFGSFG